MKTLIVPNKLPMWKHIDFLEETEDEILSAFDTCIPKMINDVIKALRSQKLIKSDTKLPAGWVDKVPVIQIDLNKILEKTLSKYMNAFRYMMLGDIAGDEAYDAAKALKMHENTPGSIFASYLQAIDSQREYYSMLFGGKSPDMGDTIAKSLDFIKNRAVREVDSTLERLHVSTARTLESLIQDLNFKNLNATQQVAHKLLDTKDKIANVKQRQAAVSSAVKEVLERRITVTKMKQSLKDNFEDFRSKDLNRLVNTELSLASSAGTHQAVVEIFGQRDDEVSIAIVALRDERTCDTCKKFSRDKDGSFHRYSMSDLKPSGWNFGVKKADQMPGVPPVHPNCRCFLVYIPKGFDIDNQGVVSKIKDK